MPNEIAISVLYTRNYTASLNCKNYPKIVNPYAATTRNLTVRTCTEYYKLHLKQKLLFTKNGLILFLNSLNSLTLNFLILNTIL